MRFVDTNVLLYVISEDEVDLAKRGTALTLLQASDLVPSVQVLQHRWGAAIFEGARAAGCDIVLTEALEDGQLFDGVRVVNPFRGRHLSAALVEGSRPTGKRYGAMLAMNCD